MRFVLPLVAIAALSSVTGAEAKFGGWFSSGNEDSDEGRKLASCTCEPDSESAWTFKCGQTNFYCQDHVTHIPSNDAQFVQVGLNTTQCAWFQQLRHGEKCSEDMDLNDNSANGLSHRVCFTNMVCKSDGPGHGEMVNENKMVEHANSANVVEEPVVQSTQAPTPNPTPAPTPNPTGFPTKSPTANPTDAPVEAGVQAVEDPGTPVPCLSISPEGNPPTYPDDAISLSKQEIDEVVFSVTNKWSSDISVSLPSGCSAGAAAGQSESYSASCSNGFLSFSIYMGTGCSSSDYYELSLPCAPVCAPDVPDCLDEPLIQAADIDYESEPPVCVYSDNPIMVETMSDTSVEFTLVDNWSTGISAVSVTYDDLQGNPACFLADDLSNGFPTDVISAQCSGGMSEVTIAIHSAGIDHDAPFDASCSPSGASGTCTFQFTIPCATSLMCNPPPPPPSDCISAALDGLKVDKVGSGPSYIDGAVKMEQQDVDSIVFTVENKWDSGAVTVSLPGNGCQTAVETSQGQADTFTATCTYGFAKVDLYLGTTSSCQLDAGGSKFEVTLPCVPVCAPTTTDCFDGPLIQAADVDIESEPPVCIYEDTPVVITEMSTNSVTFNLDDQWNTDLSSVSVAYTQSDGSTTCTLYDDLTNGINQAPITAYCTDPDNAMETVVTVTVHSSTIDHTAGLVTVPADCYPDDNSGSCSYEFVLPCDDQKMCGYEEPQVLMTAPPTGAPSASPSASPSAGPTGAPSA
ncbi:MAG: hypothetical protein SGILL_004876, partial [Bacillariaceae sp.]